MPLYSLIGVLVPNLFMINKISTFLIKQAKSLYSWVRTIKIILFLFLRKKKLELLKVKEEKKMQAASQQN